MFQLGLGAKAPWVTLTRSQHIETWWMIVYEDNSRGAEGGTRHRLISDRQSITCDVPALVCTNVQDPEMILVQKWFKSGCSTVILNTLTVIIYPIQPLLPEWNKKIFWCRPPSYTLPTYAVRNTDSSLCIQQFDCSQSCRIYLTSYYFYGFLWDIKAYSLSKEKKCLNTAQSWCYDGSWSWP